MCLLEKEGLMVILESCKRLEELHVMNKLNLVVDQETEPSCSVYQRRRRTIICISCGSPCWLDGM